MISELQLQEKSDQWKQALPELQKMVRPVVNLHQRAPLLPIDLSAQNAALAKLDVVDTEATANYINEAVQASGASGAIGGYLENRLLYLRSAVFAGVEHRTLHLGIDLWLPAGERVYNLLPGHIHSFADNANFGDYGPTIILEHRHLELSFYSLWGHLSRTSLQGLHKGDFLEAGAPLGSLGNEMENGNWPPHLHLQIMLDMLGREGDFQGVAPPSQRAYYELLCPDPGPLLKLPLL